MEEYRNKVANCQPINPRVSVNLPVNISENTGGNGIIPGSKTVGGVILGNKTVGGRRSGKACLAQPGVSEVPSGHYY